VGTVWKTWLSPASRLDGLRAYSKARLLTLPVAWTDADADATTVEVAVSVIEPLGADTLVFFDISGLEMVARVPPEAARGSGDRIRLRPDLRRMHLFDPATGTRI